MFNQWFHPGARTSADGDPGGEKRRIPVIAD